MNLKDALLKCLSSSDEVSFGRTMSAIAFLSCILWDTFSIGFAAWKFDWAHMTTHDLLPASGQLWDQVVFCGACYSITKFGDMIALFRKQ